MRLINAILLKNKAFFIHTGDSLKAVVLYKDIINTPTVDAVEVVRCKDCRWSRTNPKDAADVYYCELRTGRAYHSGDFCSYGERKDGD